MKNIKIFPKDWLQLHPYTKSTPVDSYYTGLANRIYDLFVQTELINSFEGDETQQISMRMAAYFEDVIAGLNIWRAFILSYKEMYGKYLPFYTPDDYYYDDEVNLEDVRFLIWHYTQQYHGLRKGTFVNPDNPAQEATACLIYQLFCDEWTTAPENERMSALFSAGTRYDTEEKYTELLYWFHYKLYLYPRANEEMMDSVKEFLRLNPNEDKGQAILGIHNSLAYAGATPLLALTSPEWLARIFSKEHPDYAMFDKVAKETRERIDRNQLPETKREINQTHYQKFMEVAGEQSLVYLKDLAELKDFMSRMGLDTSNIHPLTGGKSQKNMILSATPQTGLELLTQDVEAIKDKNNPFYEEEKAKKLALSFFIVPHCSIYLLRELVEKGSLADAGTTSLISPERGKAIIQENWEFLSRYFLQVYPQE